jgi:hypothetical protein
MLTLQGTSGGAAPADGCGLFYVLSARVVGSCPMGGKRVSSRRVSHLITHLWLVYHTFASACQCCSSVPP